MKTRLMGSVETPWLQSRVLAGNLPGDPTERMLPVYLPPGYADGSERYPVIYVLAGHGGSGPLELNSPPWGESFPERLDRLITTGKAPPVIAVLPDCFTIFGGAQYLNTAALGQYEDYLIDELVPYVDANYRTLADRAHRGITGKSSGGYGAMVQAMRHPETSTSSSGCSTTSQSSTATLSGSAASRASSRRSTPSSRRATTPSGQCSGCSATGRLTRPTPRRRAASTCRSMPRPGRSSRRSGSAGWRGTRCG
jgi:enterochelin esterase-like enzyme